MKILIAGDSFAADWTKVYFGAAGWPNLMATVHDVDNLAQAGCSEYRIYLQLSSVDLENYDAVIISHTSPYRIFTDYNPLRQQDNFYKHCDLLYADIANLASAHQEYASVKTYFEKFFSLEYAEFCYTLIRQQIKNIINKKPCVEIAHVQVCGHVDIDFSEHWARHQGLINHYTDQGNRTVFQKIQSILG